MSWQLAVFRETVWSCQPTQALKAGRGRHTRKVGAYCAEFLSVGTDGGGDCGRCWVRASCCAWVHRVCGTQRGRKVGRGGVKMIGAILSLHQYYNN